VLVVDDDPVHRRCVSARLESQGYGLVAQATDGHEGLAMLLDPGGPRLGIVDVMMPGLDGLAICRAVRSADLESYRYLVLVTARDQSDDVVQGLDAGADDYLVKPVGPAELGARVRVGFRILGLEEQLRTAQEALRQEARRDPLTGLLNRRGLAPLLDQQLDAVARTREPVSVVAVDVDHFKSINDRFGHGAGDVVLAETGRRLRRSLRREDRLARWGGEEFLALLPRANAEGALVVAERMRQALEAPPVRVGNEGRAIPITASFGVATAGPWAPVSAEVLVTLADQALYTAKATGRNRSVAANAFSPGGMARSTATE